MTFNLISTAVVLGVIYGILVRRDVKRHVLVMKICLIADILLLVAVEIFRGAVEVALGIQAPPEGLNQTMLWLHIPMATLSGIYWFVQLYYGSQILKGRRELLKKHGRNGLIFLVLRIGSLVTAFLLYT